MRGTQKVNNPLFCSRAFIFEIFQNGQKRRKLLSVAFHSHFTFGNQPQNERATQKIIKSVENCEVMLNKAFI